MKKTAYQKAGVDIVKADQFTGIIKNLVRTTLNKNVYKSIGGYAGLYKISNSQFIAATTDGVGTKLKIAFETGVHNSVGIDLVAMSVNDLICVGAKPLFFLDYLATGKLNLKTSSKIIQGIVNGCNQSQVALIGGETAEMPDLYAKGEYDLAGFAVGLVEKKDMLDGSRVRDGDILIGLESSGPHSNGFSLIRKLVSKTEKNLLKKVFTPTKIYVKAACELQKKLGSSLTGMAHITGSGFLNIPRICDRADYHIFIPPNLKCQDVFNQLLLKAKMSRHEGYETFNMGFGLVFSVNPKKCAQALKVLKSLKEKAHVLGYVKLQTHQKSAGNVYILDQDWEIHLK